MKRFVLILVLTVSAAGQWTMKSGSSVAPPPPPPPPPGSEPWRGIIDYSRAANWGQVGVQGGIPYYPPCNAPEATNLAPTGILAWQSQHNYNQGDVISDTRGNRQIVDVAGRSMVSEPIWPTVSGGTVVDNTLTWQMSPGTAAASLSAWQGGTNYAANARIRDRNGNTETVISAAGTSAPRNPTWSTVANGLAFDGTVTWHMAPGGTDTGKINAALQVCNGTSTAVQLQAGTYIITYGVSFNPSLPNNPTWAQSQPYNRVVLRGAGADQTKLIFYSPGPCGSGGICIQGNAGSGGTGYAGLPGGGTAGGGSAEWLGDTAVNQYAKGDTTIITGPWTSGNATSVNVPDVGDMLFLDQNNDQVSICPATPPAAGTGSPDCTVPGATQSGSSVTITTDVPHGFSVGQCVGIAFVGGSANTLAYNSINNATIQACPGIDFAGWFPITAVPTPNSFQYNLATTGLASSGDGRAVVDTGGIIQAVARGAITTESGQTGRQCPGNTTNQPIPSCRAGEVSTRAQNEAKEVKVRLASGDPGCAAPVGGYCFTIDPPLLFPNWRQSQKPGVWFHNTIKAYNLGIEDLSADFTNDYSTTSSAIRMNNVTNSWVKGIRAIAIARSSIYLQNATHISIRDNYFFGSKGINATAYTIESQFVSQSNEVVNNICQQIVNCLITNVTTGSVFGYNYMTTASYSADASGTVPSSQVQFLMPMMTLNHESSHYNLFESNNSPSTNGDNVHGAANAATAFRSRFRGQDYPVRTGSMVAVRVNAINRAYNFVGNILGTPGTQSGYQSVGGWPAGTNGYQLSNQTAIASATRLDAPGLKSTLRWGNYDAFTGATHWCGDASSPGWTTTCQGVVSATYVSGGTISTGQPWQRCGVNFSGGTSGPGFATGTVQLTGVGTIAQGTPIRIIDPGMNYTSAPGAGVFSQANVVGGFAGCSGNIQVSSTIGGVSEVPTDPVTFVTGNSVPSSTTLPASFYLSGAPLWWTTAWGTPGWPAIGPDVNASGALDTTCATPPTDEMGLASPYACDGIGHHAYQIPAQVCFNHMVLDNAYKQTYTVTNATWNVIKPNVVELTVTNPTGFIPDTNDNLMVTGITSSNVDPSAQPRGFNGTFLRLLATPTTIQYMVTASGSGPGTYAGGGTVTTPNVRTFNARACYPGDYQ